MKLSTSFLATAGLLTATLIVSGLTARRVSEPISIPLIELPAEINGWSANGDKELTPGVLRELKPTEYLSRTYKKGNMQMDLFISYYAQQRAGESMHSPKHCLPGSGWEIWKHGSAAIPVNGENLEVNKYSIQNSGVRMLMFYWYQSKNRVVASEYMGKVLLARDTLLTGQTAGSIVRIMLPDRPGAEEEGAAFAARLIPLLHRSFGGAPAGN